MVIGSREQDVADQVLPLPHLVHVQEGERLGDCLKPRKKTLYIRKEDVSLIEGACQEKDREGDREEQEDQNVEDGEVGFKARIIHHVDEVADRVDTINHQSCEALCH